MNEKDTLVPSLQCLLVGNSFGDLPRAPKAMGAAREAASSAQSNGSVGSLDRSRSMLWARSATSLALGAERRGRIERSMHQTWRFKRVNGTAYPDSIASSLRDASGADAAREAALRAQSNGTARALTRSPKAIVRWLIRTFTTDAFGSLARPPRFTERPRGARVRLRT